MKQRLDVYLVSNGLTKSRERAKELIDRAQVLVNGAPAKKAGQNILDTDKIEITGEQNPYVSRGGLKLEKAILTFSLSLSGKTAMDIGASTGGFTDCMLKNGVLKVYAVDVGSGQLDPILLSDSRVINLEKTNIRYLPQESAEKVDFISIDVSFISLMQVLPAAKAFLKAGGEIAALIKPQFEAGKKALNKKGVVKDKKVHLEVVKTILSFAESVGLYAKGLTYSPVRGPEGNIEYLAIFSENAQDKSNINAEAVVNESHSVL